MSSPPEKGLCALMLPLSGIRSALNVPGKQARAALAAPEAPAVRPWLRPLSRFLCDTAGCSIKVRFPLISSFAAVS